MRKVNLMSAVTIVLVVLSFSVHSFAGENAISAVLEGSSAVKVNGEPPACLNMIRGNIVATGGTWDTAIWGEGYIVFNDGLQELYSRGRSLAINGEGYLVDPYTGYYPQRIGTTGESDGFQSVDDNDIHIPYDTPYPPYATSMIAVQGNLSSDSSWATSQTQQIKSDIKYTTNNITADSTTLISALDQYTGLLSSGTITFSGYKPDGASLANATPPVNLTMPIDDTTTLGDLEAWLDTNEGTPGVDEVQTISISGTPTGGTFTLTFNGKTTFALSYNATAAQIEMALDALSVIGAGEVACLGGPLPNNVVVVIFNGWSLGETDVNSLVFNSSLAGGISPAGVITEKIKGRAVQGVLGTEATAAIVGGKITITDVASGYSRTDLSMTYGGDGMLTVPRYFELTAVGGGEIKNVSYLAQSTI